MKLKFVLELEIMEITPLGQGSMPQCCSHDGVVHGGGSMHSILTRLTCPSHNGDVNVHVYTSCKE